MIERLTLQNGLRVVADYDPTTAMAAVNILYNVGGRDESPQLTGLAHLFEHLMFGGSVNVDDYDGELQQAGGMSNAWTSNDFTNFYDIVPAHNIETALRIESDRMLSLSFSDKALEVQRSVVIEEFKQQCLNQPYGDLGHHLRHLVYKEHPYRTPVIGETPEHIARVTQDDVRRFFFSHYAPNNATIVVSGNLKPDEVFRLVEKWFGDIPRREIAPRALAAEPEQTSPRRAEASGRVPLTSLTHAYRMDGYGTKDYFAADLLTDLLANGESSRFYRNLLNGSDIFSAVDASILGSEDPGILMVSARLTDGSEQGIRRAEEAIDAEIAKIITTPPTQQELTRAVNRMNSAYTFGNLSYLPRSQTLAMCEMHGETMADYIRPYRDLTPDDISSVARKIIDPGKRNTLIYRPQ